MKKLFLFFLLFSATLQADVRPIEDFTLANYQGQVVYLDFWASWCKPCQKSFPWMNSLVKRYPAERFKVITINLDENTRDMERFLQKTPAGFTVYHDASGRIAEQFELEGMPTSLLIDRNGKVVSKHIGFYESKKAQIESEIEELL